MKKCRKQYATQLRNVLAHINEDDKEFKHLKGQIDKMIKDDVKLRRQLKEMI